ncbi:Uncharacterised protein [Legionella beliardensis]|uniref:Uncharacterized protein n=1 Tax=Legionella beliardensis TaxID=91822 RepID=A0A378I794_9GAMM|nr:hypothetical protein [Legionella beliardensis]STX28294.1 Uncharacterised protein [Legionella beliardensis]
MPNLLREKLLQELTKLKVSPSDSGLDKDGITIILHEFNKANPTKPPIRLIDRQHILDEIKKEIAKNPAEARNQQFIVKIDEHYCVVDLEIDEQGNFQALVLDAANDLRFLDLVEDISSLAGLNKLYLVTGITSKHNIHKDSISCPIFAISHALALNETPLFKHLEQEQVSKTKFNEHAFDVKWHHMPPQIMVNCQSNTLWERYKQDYAKAFNSPNDCFREYDGFRWDMQARSFEIDKEGSTKYQGNIMPAVFEKLTEKAKQFVLSQKDSELENIINPVPPNSAVQGLQV